MKRRPALTGVVVGLVLMLEPLSYAAAASRSSASPSGAEASPASTEQGAPSAAPDKAQPRLSLEEATALLDALMEQVEKLRSAIDRTQFDLDALGRSLGGEVDEILRFVRTEIAFEQYPGLLRGAQGTLMSRAGNALDQAVLLSTLLEDAGYETRIARGRLTGEQAAALLQEMARPRAPEPPLGQMDTIRQIVAEIGRLADLGEEELAARLEAAFQPLAIENSELFQAAQRDAEFILGRLEEAGISLGQPEFAAQLAAEASDYFWVEYRLLPTDEWTAAHPAFGDAKEGPSLEATTFLPQPVPAELEHRLRIRAFVEQTVDSKATSFPIMDPWERPAWKLIGKPMTFINYPDGAQGLAKGIDLREALAQTTIFLPLLDSRPPKGALAFNLNGDRYELNEIAETRVGVRPLARDTRGLLGTMSEALEGLDTTRAEGSSGGTLTGFRIDYTLVIPGGETRTHSRLEQGLPPRSAGESGLPAEADPGTVKAGLARLRTWMVAAGRYPAGYVLDRPLAELGSMAGLFRRLLESAHAKDVPLVDEMSRAGLEWLGHLGTYRGFDLGTPATAIGYRPEPSLAVYLQGLCSHDLTRLCASMDVISQRYSVLGTTAGRIEQRAEAAVRMGTWVTHTEGAVLAPGRERTLGTPEVLADARRRGVAIRLLAPKDESALRSLSLSERMKGFIGRDLRSGYAVLVPERVAAGQSSMSGWWRVDPRTGETLGMTSDGRGQATVDWVELQHWFVLSISLYSVCVSVADIVTPWSQCALVTYCTGGMIGMAVMPLPAVVGALAHLVGLVLGAVGNSC